MPVLVCVVPVCPVRAEPSHRSEQTTQLLFGERCHLLERTKDFVRIKILYDNYEGWCQSTQLEESNVSETSSDNQRLAGDWSNQITFNNTSMQIPFASSLPLHTGNDFFANNQVIYNGNVIEPANSVMNAETVTRLAYTFINTPYLWGGRSVFGIDCSGLTQTVYKCMNIPLQRDAWQQAMQGEAIGFLQETQCGDLAFFDNEAGKITHTGILLNAETIIHASGKVRVDTIDNLGIINKDTGRRTHNLRIIKRLVQ